MENKLIVLPKIALQHKLWNKNETIAFIHIPKTGGTNLDNVMSATKCINNREGQNFNGRRIFARRSTKTSDLEFPIEIDCSMLNVDFMLGHFPLPEKNNEDKYFSKCNLSYISVAREPIARDISFTNYMLQIEQVKEKDAIEFLLEKSPDNAQTRYYAGEKYMQGKCTEETLAKAKENIKTRFKFVAPNTDIEIVMSILAEYFGHSNMAYSKANITGLKIINEQDPILIAKLKEKNKYDIKLYEFIEDEWKIWKKQNIVSIEKNDDLKSDKKYVTMMPGFPVYEKIQQLTLKEILAHNQKNAKSQIINISEILKSQIRSKDK